MSNATACMLHTEDSLFGLGLCRYTLRLLSTVAVVVRVHQGIQVCAVM